MTMLGLDIGGANLKAAHTNGVAHSRPFALWRHPERLSTELASLVPSLPPAEGVAVTMTGELCDCFASKREGVAHILQAVESVFPTVPLHVWTTQGRFVCSAQARDDWQATASANWLALATFAGRIAPAGLSLLVDIGTTTTDLIVLKDGVPQPIGRTDRDRLASGELLYRGWRRTPLMALDPRGAAELFATMHDVCMVLNLVPEDANDRDTADGQPATRAHALKRLARMRCSEIEDSDETEWVELARGLRGRLHGEIDGCLMRLLDGHSQPITACILSGSGVCLLPADWPGVPSHRLEDAFSPGVSEAACAYAVAVLAAERAVCAS
jgi:probable H4MPT-linked C1 transfer pathway protein